MIFLTFPFLSVIWKGTLLGFAIFMLRKWVTSRWAIFRKIVSCRDRIIVLTGATSGIGRAAAEEFAKLGASLVLACRDLEQANQVAKNLRRSYPNCKVLALKLDLSDFDSVDDFCRQCRSNVSKIDILVLNAGVAFCPYEKTPQGLELQMGVNHFGHARLLLGLISLLKKGSNARVVQVSSSLHKNSELPDRLNSISGEAQVKDLCYMKSNYSKKIAYSDSKLAGMLFIKELSRRYSAIRWYSVSPGIVNTKLGRHRSTFFYIVCLPLYIPFALLAVRTPWQGCQTLLYAALDDSIDGNFGYFRDCRQQPVSSLLLNCSLSEKLFDATQEIINQCDNDE